MDLEVYSDASESEPCEVTPELAEAAPNLDKAGLGRQFFCHRPSLIDHFNQRLFSLPTFLSERWSALIVDLSYLIDEHSCEHDRAENRASRIQNVQETER